MGSISDTKKRKTSVWFPHLRVVGVVFALIGFSCVDSNNLESASDPGATIQPDWALDETTMILPVEAFEALTPFASIDDESLTAQNWIDLRTQASETGLDALASHLELYLRTVPPSVVEELVEREGVRYSRGHAALLLARVLSQADRHDASVDAFRQLLAMEENPWTNNEIRVAIVQERLGGRSLNSFIPAQEQLADWYHNLVLIEANFLEDSFSPELNYEIGFTAYRHSDYQTFIDRTQILFDRDNPSSVALIESASDTFRGSLLLMTATSYLSLGDARMACDYLERLFGSQQEHHKSVASKYMESVGLLCGQEVNND